MLLEAKTWTNYQRLLTLDELACHLAAQDRAPRHDRVHDWPRDVPPRHRLESLLLTVDHPDLWTDAALIRNWRQRVSEGQRLLEHGPDAPVWLLVREALIGDSRARFAAEHGRDADW